MRQYLCTVCVKLKQPLKVEDDASTVTVLGYYRNFGVGATSETVAFSLISKFVEDGNIDFTDSSCKEIDLASFDKEIRSHCNDTTKEAIWYMSGRSFFPDEETFEPGGSTEGAA